MLIDKREKVGIKKLKIKKLNPKTFIDYSKKIDGVYENFENYNLTKKRRVLIVFDDMIVDMESNKKFGPIVTDLFLRGTKLNISLVFISQSNSKETKTIRLNETHYVIMKSPNKRKNSTNSVISFV